MEANTLEAVLSNIGTIFTSVMGWVGTILTDAFKNPIVLLFVGITIITSIVFIAKRFFKIAK